MNINMQVCRSDWGDAMCLLAVDCMRCCLSIQNWRESKVTGHKAAETAGVSKRFALLFVPANFADTLAVHHT